MIALELMGPYPRLSLRKSGILIVTDLLTGWVEAFAIREATASCILHVPQVEVFSRYGYLDVYFQTMGHNLIQVSGRELYKRGE